MGQSASALEGQEELMPVSAGGILNQGERALSWQNKMQKVKGRLVGAVHRAPRKQGKTSKAWVRFSPTGGQLLSSLACSPGASWAPGCTSLWRSLIWILACGQTPHSSLAHHHLYLPPVSFRPPPHHSAFPPAWSSRASARLH